MKFVAIADTHGKHRLLKALPEADVLIHAGDISLIDDTHLAEDSGHQVEDFINWFSGLDYEYKFFIAGNHDFYLEESADSFMRKRLPKNVFYLNDSKMTVGGVQLWGSPITPRYWDWAFNRERGTAINKHWKLIPVNTDILITHGPTYGTLDKSASGEHLGCKDLWKKIGQIKPKVHICGHIHESYGTEKNLETLFINASVVNEKYALVNPPIEFSL